jgi:hypothetical protein
VRFVEARDVKDEIDAAYRRKYRRYDASYVDAVVSSQARTTTIRLVPRPKSR